jgi:hypothetical protein
MTSIPLNGAGHPGKKKITGRDLGRWLSHASILTRLCVAAAIASGELDPDELTLPQIARMLGVKSKQVRAVMALSAEQRAALTTTRRANSVARFTDEVIDDFVDKVGANRLWSALDRASAPKSKLNGNGIHHAA